MDALVQMFEPLGHLAEYLAEEAAQLDFFIIEQTHLAAQGCDAFSYHDSVFTKQAMDFVSQCGSPRNATSACHVSCVN